MASADPAELADQLLSVYDRDDSPGVAVSVFGACTPSNGDTGRRFVTEPAVGRYLTERVFQPGSRRHWQSALEFATGERLHPQYFVDQVKG